MMTLKKAQRTENPGNSARILASVSLPEFDGSTHTIVRRYRDWRQAVQAARVLNNLGTRNLLISSSHKGLVEQRPCWMCWRSLT